MTRWPDAAASSATFISAPVARSARAPARRDPRAAPRAPPRARPRLLPRTSRWLTNELPALVDDVDLALDRDHVVAPRAVDQVDERRNQRPLAARPRPGDEHQAFGLDRQRLNLPRQPELIDRHGAHGHQPEHAAGAAMIAEAHAADAADRLRCRRSIRSSRPCAAPRGCAPASASAADDTTSCDVSTGSPSRF